MLAYWLVTGAAFLLLLWLVAEPAWRERRRRQLRGLPLPQRWRKILRRRVPLVARLPAALQLQLKAHMQVFLAEKPFIGCAGLQVTDEMRVTVAAQACLLLLNRRTDYYAGLRQVLLYPDSFLVQRVATEPGGVLREQRHALAGESWSQGQVILSWQDVLAGAADPDDGRNVVIHEFAHQLDQQTGSANGAPLLGGRRQYRHWSGVLGAEFARLQQQAAAGQPSLLSHYGATDPAEFFAVASEVFFEQGQRLQAEHPALYQQLAQYYCLSPAQW